MAMWWVEFSEDILLGGQRLSDVSLECSWGARSGTDSRVRESSSTPFQITSYIYLLETLAQLFSSAPHQREARSTSTPEVA